MRATVDTISGIYDQDIAYDSFGNIVGKAGGFRGDPVETREFEVDTDTNRLVSQTVTRDGVVSSSTFSFDANGDLAADGTRSYEWDVEGRLQVVDDSNVGRLAEHDYDSQGYRHHVLGENVETFFIRDLDGNVLSEFARQTGTTSHPTWDKDYIFLAGKSVVLVKNQKPSTPRRPTASNVTANGLILRWPPVLDPDVSNYRIRATYYRDGATGNAFTYYVYPPPTEYADTFVQSALSATKIEYKLDAIDTAGNMSAPSSPTLLVRPLGPNPPVPGGLAGEIGDRRIKVTWLAVTDDDLAGYDLERAVDTGVPPLTYVRLNAEPIDEPFLVDSEVVNGQQYSFRVRAVDTSGRVSSWSGPLALTPQDSTAPSPPFDLVGSRGLLANTVELDWQGATEDDVSGYRIDRSAAPGFESPTVFSIVAGPGGRPSFSDSTAVGGSDYFYRVASRDSSGNESVPSPVVVVRPRRDDIPAPSLVSATYEVDDKGTVSQDGYPGSATEDGSNTWAEDDDVIRVRVAWDGVSQGSADAYRIYRRSDVGDYSRLDDVVVGNRNGCGDPQDPSPATRYNYCDLDAPNGDYRYYVVSLKTMNSTEEESAASTGAGEAGHAEDLFSPSSLVRNLTADDGRDWYETFNKLSRVAFIHWSRVVESQIAGYNVYRRCDARSGEVSGWLPTTDASSCQPSWVRVNPYVVSPKTQLFEDRSLGGLGGAYEYVVRAAGKDGRESNIHKALVTDLCGGCEGNYIWWYPHRAASHWHYDPWDNYSQLADDLAAINSTSKGTGAPEGAPAAPVVQPVSWTTKYVRNNAGNVFADRQTVFFAVSWSRNQESDLKGYRIEVAGSGDGPWRPAFDGVLAWWETHYEYLGAGALKDQRDAALLTSYAGNLDCLHFRVIAVDENSNESAPGYPPNQPVSGCPQTPEPPTHLVASTYELIPNQSCKTLLEWDPAPGAEVLSRGV